MPDVQQPDPFDDVVVSIPTVAVRADVLSCTLDQWRRFGVTPLIQLQPAEWPRSAASHRANVDTALQRARVTHPHAKFVLVAEDDLLLHPQLDVWMPALKALDLPVTLFLHGTHHYPPRIQRILRTDTQVPERIFQVRHLGAWWGSQAVLIPRWLWVDLLAWHSLGIGWDVHFQWFLRTHELPLFASVPNLVQQIDTPTSVPGNQIIPQSATFGRATDGSGISLALPRNFTPRGSWQPDLRLLPGDEPPDSEPDRRTSTHAEA